MLILDDGRSFLVSWLSGLSWRLRVWWSVVLEDARLVFVLICLSSVEARFSVNDCWIMVNWHFNPVPKSVSLGAIDISRLKCISSLLSLHRLILLAHGEYVIDAPSTWFWNKFGAGSWHSIIVNNDLSTKLFKAFLRCSWNKMLLGSRTFNITDIHVIVSFFLKSLLSLWTFVFNISTTVFFHKLKKFKKNNKKNQNWNLNIKNIWKKYEQIL